MKRSTQGTFMFVILGVIVILGFALVFKPWKEKHDRESVSGGKVDTELVNGGDNFIGYWLATLCTEFQKAIVQRGVGQRFVPDDANCVGRIARLAAGELDIIEIPFSSYVKYGHRYNYPGVIVGVCSESIGADVILVNAEMFPDGKLDVLDQPNIRVACTLDSPSEDLVDLTFNLMDFVHFSKRQLVPAKGSADAIKMLLDGTVQAAVAWEPDATREMKKHPGKFRAIVTSRDFRYMIMDVYVASIDSLISKRQAFEQYFAAYYGVLNQYVLDRERLLTDMARTPKIELTRDELDTVIRKIDWYTLRENCRFFGISGGNNRLLDGILYWRSLYQSNGQLPDTALKNPLSIINKSILEGLRNSPLMGVQGEALDSFPPLSDDAWSKLTEKGNIRLDPIRFETGSAELQQSGKEALDRVAPDFKHMFSDCRMEVCGHTADGDEEANQRLSLARAQAVIKYLVEQHEVDPDRLHAKGLGSSGGPPKRKPDEPYKMWQGRRSRVEIVLLEDVNL